jgi:outer membrane protein assembly factor BamB
MRQILYGSLIVLSVLGCRKEMQQSNTPETIWTTALSNGTETASMNPVLYKDWVIYSADDGNISKSKLVALNRNTGKLIWEWKNTNEALGDMSLSHTYVQDNVLVIPILGRPYQVVAINLDNGTQLWHHTLPEGGSWQLVGSGNLVFQIRRNFDRMKDEIFMADVHTGNWQSLYAASNVNAPIYIQGMHTYKAGELF